MKTRGEEGSESTVARSPAREAFEAIEPELPSIDADSVLKINLDIHSAVATALISVPRLAPLREQMVELPYFDVSKFDKLETYALATRYAHINLLIASAPTEPIAPLIDELVPTRGLLFADASVLGKRNLLNGERLKNLKGGAGFKNLAFDVMLLVALLRDHWDVIAKRTGVRMADLDRAQLIAERLVLAVSLRAGSPRARSEVNDVRRRTFTLFMNAYQEVRRGVLYLRCYNNDADHIVPSLFKGRGGSGKKADRKAKAQADALQETEAAEPAVNHPIVVAPTHSPIASDPAAAPGMPLSDPFER